jgi:serine/threonine protein phosphatase PrpC/CRP-like cAMP-binding protein
MQLQFWAATDVGLTRDHNEDNYLVDRKLNLFVVADGMGGHAAGEIASSVAVHEVRKTLMSQRQVLERYERSGSVLQRQTVLTLLDNAISNACRLVYQLAQDDSERHGMGTTLSLLILVRNRAFVGHVGDSRIYRTREGLVTQVTEDHSVINELIKSGRIKPEDAFNSPYKNAVTRAVGVHPSVEVDTFDFEIKAGDNYLLCSDGLSCYLEDPLTLSFMTQEDVKQIPQDLIDHSNDSGGKDNITAVMIRVMEVTNPNAATNFGLNPPPLPPHQATSSVNDDLSELSFGDESLAEADDDFGDEQALSEESSSHLPRDSYASPTQVDPTTESTPPPLPTPSSSAMFSDERPTPAAHFLDQLPLDVLKVSPIFGLLSQDNIEDLAARAEVIQLEAEGVLHFQGELDETLYIILSGELRAERDDVKQFVLNAGALCGETQLLMPTPADMTLIAHADTTLLAWSRYTLHSIMEQSPAISTRLMWGLALLNHQRTLRLQRSLEVMRELFELNPSRQNKRDEWIAQANSLMQSLPASLEVHTPLHKLPKFLQKLPLVDLPPAEVNSDEAQDILSREVEQLKAQQDQNEDIT